jgi:hypothetical protein
MLSVDEELGLRHCLRHAFHLGIHIEHKPGEAVDFLDIEVQLHQAEQRDANKKPLAFAEQSDDIPAADLHPKKAILKN